MHTKFLYWFISTNVVFTSFKGDYSSTIWLWCVPHCPKNNLKHGIKILAVTSGTDSTVNVWLLNTTWCRENRLPSTPLHLLQLGIYAEIQIFFGTVCILVSGMVYRNVFCQSGVSPSRPLCLRLRIPVILFACSVCPDSSLQPLCVISFCSCKHLKVANHDPALLDKMV